MSKKRTPHPPKTSLEVRRIYSETFRRQRVLDIEQGLLTVLETSRLYGIPYQTIYKWIHKYSTTMKHKARQVVELESEEHKTKALLERVAELERVVGHKQLEIDLLKKLVDAAEEELGPDWKKKQSSTSSSGSATTDPRTPTP
jgi:transposase-like protein